MPIIAIFHFRLKSNSALKNLKHNFCVHPYGGWPGEGVSLVYWASCGNDKLKLDFFKLGEYCPCMSIMKNQGILSSARNPTTCSFSTISNNVFWY